MSKSRKQREKAKHRTGLIKSLTGPHSSNQRDKKESNKSFFPQSWKDLFGY